MDPSSQEETTSLTEHIPLPDPRPPVGEEIANSVSHGVGLLATLIAGPLLIVQAVGNDKPWGVTGAIVFVAATTALYLASTLYHAFPQGRAKHVLLILEHCMIYVLIAGTYTPVTLVAISGTWGWVIFWLVWLLAVVGILFKTMTTTKYRWLPGVLYLALGWLIVIAVRPLWLSVPVPGLMWLLAGGLAYSGGLPFFAAKQIPYGHFVWHMFVLAGTTCHFVAIGLYVV